MPVANDPLLEAGLFDLLDAIQNRLYRLEISRLDAQGPVSGGSGIIVADEGADLPSRARLSFQGAGVGASDDPANNRIVVLIPGPDITLSMLTAHKSSGDHDSRYYLESEVDTLLALKANLSSPALTGNPTAPTPAAADNDTSIATTAFVQSAVSASSGSKAFAYMMS